VAEAERDGYVTVEEVMAAMDEEIEAAEQCQSGQG
jgi:hypothetical protein